MAEKVIRVFISSTFEDLQEEREIIKQGIIEEMSSAFCSSGIFLHPVDLRTGARPNPPKEECLEEVAKSQIVIGIIAFRYGSIDEQTGKSISELEYDKACDCNIPALMYIKDPDSEVKTYHFDTQQDLIEKRGAFQTKVEKDRIREKFKTKEELWKKVHSDLSRMILEKFLLTFKEREAQATESPETPATESGGEVVPQVKELSGGANEVKQLLKSISGNLSDLKNVDGQKRRRLLLLATSMFYGKELSGGLGTHEIQLLYRQRKNMSLLTSEISFLVKNVYADVYRIKAGWFWVKDFESRFVLGHLQWLCINEEDEDIRIGCLGLLKNFWSRETEEIVSKNMLSTKKKIRLEALKILEELAPEKCLAILDNTESDEDTGVQKAVKRAKLAILARTNPTKAVSFIKEFIDDIDTGPPTLFLEDIMPKIETEGLKELREHENKKIKQMATAELARRGELDDNEIKALAKESDEELRYLGYKDLIDKGEKFNIEEVRNSWPKQNAPFGGSLLLGLRYGRFSRLNEVIGMILKTYSIEELTKSLGWMSFDRELVYLELGLKKGPEFLGQVRKDLENKFDRIKKAYRNELDSLLLDSKKQGQMQIVNRVQSLIDNFNKESQEYTENLFTKSALKILMEHGEKEDIRFAKQFRMSDEHGIKEIATELFVKLASQSELSTLVEIALSDTGGIKGRAARKALSIGKNGSVLETFLKSNNSILIKLCLKQKLKKKLLLEREKIEELLLSENEDIREITVAYLMKALEQKRARLERVLDKYLENQTYYYNVVCWLDRILYAPRTFKIMFRKQLAAKLDE